MKHFAIKAENLSKTYPSKIRTGKFWKRGETGIQVLKNLNFEIYQAEIIALCGHNGAGKSTLLKILSRITSPSSGLVRGRGRISSLLEGSIGFHPELSGMENIYLTGAMLGMKKTEIRAAADQICEFAGLNEQVQQPVKKYSSGMYMRLALSSSLHLAAGIVILDEVLAVGDIQFQKNALQKIKQMNVNEGKTFIMVGHNESQLQQICTRKITLINGEIAESI